uniref:DUF1618 domain-containing protein n=1 Tax=Aegilops tauschii TaxID=37682 RepID=R7WFF5_AEGTA
MSEKSEGPVENNSMTIAASIGVGPMSPTVVGVDEAVGIDDGDAGDELVLGEDEGGGRAAAPATGKGTARTLPVALYHSEKEAWSIKTAKVSGDAPYNHHWTDKAIAIGRDDGVVAWVNLGRDILFCDVLAETPTLCPIELPPLIPPSKGVGTSGDPRCSRDVAIADGFIHYTQLQPRIVPGSFMDDGAVTFDGWKAAKCSMAIDARSLPLAEASWQHTGLLELDSSQISMLLPSLVVDDGSTIAFERLHVGLPTLSLRD